MKICIALLVGTWEADAMLLGSLSAAAHKADNYYLPYHCRGTGPVQFNHPNSSRAHAQHAASKAFLQIVNSGHPAETLCVNRHRCCMNKEEPLNVPKALRLFDWSLLYENELEVNTGVRETRNFTEQQPNPKSVYCHVDHLDDCLSWTDQLPALGPGENRVLAMGQGDTFLSRRYREVQKLMKSRKYSTVLYEAKDMKMKGVSSLPQCLNTWYIRRNNVTVMLEAIQRANFDLKNETAFAAWGAIFPGLDRKLESRRQAAQYVKKSCLVKRYKFQPPEYWQALLTHRFFLVPTGNSIFTPKVMEALLALCIPIVQREPDGGAWDELKEYFGWPVAIVDRWEEITPAKLQMWWTELAPRLQEARLKLTAGNWFETVMHKSTPEMHNSVGASNALDASVPWTATDETQP